ncbi:MAG: apolipoprotein N-acyltransferase [Gammaproteobacteria bacterium]
MNRNYIVLNSLALVAGALLTLAFAPFHLFPLAIISPAILLSIWLKSSTRQAFWRGWLFGVGLFTTGVYWIYISVHTFGNASAFFAILVTGALIGILALFPAMNGYFLNRFFPNNNTTKILCAFPAIWVLLEWLRTWIFSGFPWLFIGTSQIISPLKGYAPIFSVYGVSLAALLSSALLVNTVIEFKRSHQRHAYFNLAGLALIWIVGGCLSTIAWTQPTDKQIKVSLVQGNIAQDLKWSPEHVQPTLDRYVELTQPHWDSQIIVWPESAIPVPFQTAADFLNSMAYKAKEHQSTFITGIPMKAPKSESYYNSVIALGNGGGVYAKRLLVPFGEYIPMRSSLGHILDLLHVPMSDFIPNTDPMRPIEANGVKIATFICYEIAYPEQVLLRDGNIDLILTVSNDAWFGHSIAQSQHLEMAQMRALEMGRPVLFASNDGITAIINARGKIQARAPQYQSYVLTGEVQTVKGKTPWQTIAMDPILMILVGLLIVAIVRRKQHAN